MGRMLNCPRTQLLSLTGRLLGLLLVTGKVEIFIFPNRRHPQYLSQSFEVVIPTLDHCQDENHGYETSTAAAGPAVGVVSLASIAEQFVSAYHAIRGFENGLEL